MLKPRNTPKPDYEWLAERIQPSPAAPKSDIKIRLDGFFTASYSNSYAAAWQALLPRVKELAIPILYLQRHTLELIVKDTIRSLLAIRDEMQVGHEVFGLPAPAVAVDEARAVTGHKFEPLFDCLAQNLKVLALPELPDEFHRARALLEAVERGDETRLRYDTLKGRLQSFDYDPNAPKVADIGQISDLLGTIGSVHRGLSDDPINAPVSFVDHIAQRGMNVEYDIQAELERLETATRSDEVVWKWARTPRVTNHPDLKPEYNVDESCLTATYGGRQFLILGVPDLLEDHSHVLACRAGRRLSRLLWPPPYRSNVVFAALDSVERHHDADEGVKQS